ncbi:MAG: 4Fe-4S binding protein [Eubacteriales bacterium]|nr:4Fe-4S binding protein [Eubacteriales bacterium]MDY3332224.1 4Fe-4S binding protein [Gallibacter sp.]
MAKGKLTIRTDRCKGCKLCVSVCPKQILALEEVKVNAKGYHNVYVVDQDACIACGSCGIICPDGVINVYKEEA